MSERGRRRRVAAVAVASAIAAGFASVALAPTSMADDEARSSSRGKAVRTVQVSGQLITVDVDTGTYDVVGELIGTWRIPPAEASTYYLSDTRYIQKGVEYFEGCVNLNGDSDCDRSEPSGRFRSDLISWGSYDSRGRFVDGGCTHAFTGGNQAFTGVRGLLHMSDVYSSTAPGNTIASYQGDVILNAVDEGPISAQPASIGLSAKRSTGVAGGC